MTDQKAQLATVVEAQRAAREAQGAARKAELELRAAIHEARRTMSGQEIAQELGISRQRVWQLLKD